MTNDELNDSEVIYADTLWHAFHDSMALSKTCEFRPGTVTD
jgi:hypothetical protein